MWSVKELLEAGYIIYIDKFDEYEAAPGVLLEYMFPLTSDIWALDTFDTMACLSSGKFILSLRQYENQVIDDDQQVIKLYVLVDNPQRKD